MAITTSIARHFAVRLIVMTIVLLVLGLWGVYDYAIAIPAQQRVFERYQALSLTQRAMQPDLAGEELQQTVSEANTAIAREIETLLDEHAARADIERSEIESPFWWQTVLLLSDESNVIPDEVKNHPQFAHAQALHNSLNETNQLEWMKALVVFQQALQEPRAPGGGLSGSQQVAYQISEAQMSAVSKDEVPTPPSTFDRVTQLAFISCLLGVPYLLWVHVATVRRVYRLEDDGTLHTPEATWPADQIADIDMSRWMAKSMAYVVHTDGSRITLDDYKHRDMHKIVSALAHRFHPEEWTPEAKPVKKEAEDDELAEPLDGSEEDVLESEGERV